MADITLKFTEDEATEIMGESYTFRKLFVSTLANAQASKSRKRKPLPFEKQVEKVVRDYLKANPGMKIGAIKEVRQFAQKYNQSNAYDAKAGELANSLLEAKLFVERFC